MADFPAEEFRLDGDPGAIRSSASQWSLFGQKASDAAGQIRSLDTSLFIGPEGDQYREGLDDKLPPHLDVTGQAYGKVAVALSSYADTLSGLQDRMRPLAGRAPGLWQALQAAQGRVSSAQAADRRHGQQVQADALTRPKDQPAPPDTYHSDTGAASTSLSQAQQAWNDCLTAARKVKTDLHTAIDTASRTIHEAADMRFKHNPHGFGALVAGFKGFVKDNLGSLAKLSNVLKTISGITGVLSLIPGVGPAFLAVSLATGGAALLIDLTTMGVTGKWNLVTLAVDGLALLPAVGKLSVLRGARSAEAAVDGMPAASRAVGGAGPVLKGQAGVNATVAEIEAAGGRVLGREITIEANGVRTRPDLYVEFPNGQRGFVEVKTGPHARPTANQRAAFPAVNQTGYTGVGGNATQVGIAGPQGPAPVYIVHRP